MELVGQANVMDWRGVEGFRGLTESMDVPLQNDGTYSDCASDLVAALVHAGDAIVPAEAVLVEAGP